MHFADTKCEGENQKEKTACKSNRMPNTCEVFKMWHKVVKNFNEFWQSELNEQSTAKSIIKREKEARKIIMCVVTCSASISQSFNHNLKFKIGSPKFGLKLLIDLKIFFCFSYFCYQFLWLFILF